MESRFLYSRLILSFHARWSQIEILRTNFLISYLDTANSETKWDENINKNTAETWFESIITYLFSQLNDTWMYFIFHIPNEKSTFLYSENFNKFHSAFLRYLPENI